MQFAVDKPSINHDNLLEVTFRVEPASVAIRLSKSPFNSWMGNMEINQIWHGFRY
jgi:hypothetical protein